MIKNKILFIFLLLMPLVACGNATKVKKLSVLDVKKELRDFLFSKYDDFQITEIFSKSDNKKVFLQSKLGKEFVKNTEINESSEMLFKELVSGTDSHIGVAVIEYDNATNAKRAIASIGSSGYFKNAKILTRYFVVNRDTRNLVVYTESVGDKQILTFIELYQKKLVAH
ncbi:hypothetical protein [Aliikangiella sp. IMCC44359]|uniref:hypothetical protein n=1 Tax=Aliikangiella sp. IMCC44359 TaxID=3459125 RepID=UPI00403AA827